MSLKLISKSFGNNFRFLSTRNDNRRKIQESTLDLVGNTPLLKLKKITKGLEAMIAVKMEYMNPACSVKDRIALAMIEDAEKKGLIKPGKTVLVEPTSGNMGIALSMLCAARGYKLILTMPSSMSVERRALMKAYGALCVLTNPATAVKAAVERASELIQQIPNAHMLNQYSNPSNPLAHYQTTGPEIWAQTEGKVDIGIFGVGSAGTFTGVGRFLKEKNPNIQMYPVEPYESSVINGFQHTPHKIQGIGVAFIPDNLDQSLFTEALRVHSDDAIAMAKRLAKEEGILGGISSGANLVAAIRLAQRPENKGKLIVTAVNSFGERYLSTALYQDIQVEAQKMGETSIDEDLKNIEKWLRE
ncbi:unnamed protein product, partial [Mesorhabditis belari]|uniref:Cysteine synthase n=1 Tax=Mesorhabditis belari TaxID=2138241 RepID=A0AAF3FGP4_9BILA